MRDRNSVAASRKNKTKQSFANNVFDVMIKSTQGQVRHLEDNNSYQRLIKHSFQVQQLIEEAIDEKNLFQMFSGWVSSISFRAILSDIPLNLQAPFL